ncbi:NACHT domain-containing protein [Argonema galeatum]|uniref:NACHT domain-containing protein n=1 Tax=Argonema galeatum TaxID=2942762 RepID=UPI00201100EB|nr:NACHT domain-containing protein [Argonema galeatum]MCL1465563.1 NACHT domain-containing protein [Argonema galeatum A003/A1]
MPTPDLPQLSLWLLNGLLAIIAGLLINEWGKPGISYRRKWLILGLGAGCGLIAAIVNWASGSTSADYQTYFLVLGYAYSLLTILLLSYKQNTENPSPRNQLLKAVRDEVAQRLEVSLHNQKMIDLAAKELPHNVGGEPLPAVNPDNRQPINWIELPRQWVSQFLRMSTELPRRWVSQFLGMSTSTVATADNGQNVHPADEKIEKIIDVFKRKDGKLLILGEPGAGKTTTLLDLAKDLCAEATENENEPIPILLDLFSWKDNSQSLTEWLVAELKTKYGVRADIAQILLDEHQLLPFLDGLDEQEETRRVSCLRQINEFLETDARARHLVVCSRLKEFENCKSPLRLNGAVCLQPLEESQMQKYFSAVGGLNLLPGIKKAPDLLELAKSPLLLNLMALASSSISIPDWQKCNTPDERQRYLFDKYIEQMFTREIKREFEPHYSQGQQPNEADTRKWLVWLAKQLKDKNQTEFLIEKMQPNWLYSGNQKGIYRLISGLIVVLIVALIWGLTLGLIFGLIFDIIFGASARIEPVETLKWSWKKALNLLKNCLITIIVFIAILSLVFVLDLNKYVLVGTLIWGIFFCILVMPIVVIIGGFINRDIEILNSKQPNQGIWESAYKAVLFTVITGSFVGITFNLILQNGLITITSPLEPMQPLIIEPIEPIITGLIIGLLFAIFFAGGACIQHFSLRLILWQHGDIPWNYAKFLNYSSERLFLQRIGGRYRFIHDLLREHFAQM